MGRQIVRQPNGKLAVWSSCVDDFIIIDATVEEIIEDRVRESRSLITSEVEGVIRLLECGEKPYHQLTRSFEQCVETIKSVHGEDAESLSMLRGDVK